jgi:hypothetical protein
MLEIISEGIKYEKANQKIARKISKKLIQKQHSRESLLFFKLGLPPHELLLLSMFISTSTD